MGETLSRDIYLYEQDLCSIRSVDSSSRSQSDLVSKILRRGKRPNKPDERGDTALHKAAASGNDQLLEILLKKYGNIIDQENQDGLTPFHLAVLYGRIECAKMIADINPSVVNSVFSKNPFDFEYSVKDRNGKFLFVINNFSKLEEKKICSDVFQIGGCKWRLVVYPNGYKTEDYLSVYLEVVGHENLSDKWSFLVNFKFSLINQLTGEESITREVMAHRFSKNHTDLGFAQFVKKSSLMNRKSGLLHRDRLVIKIFKDVLEGTSYGDEELSGYFSWRIENLKNTRDRIVSDLFYVGGFPWVLVAYPRGKSSNDHLSLYLKISNTEVLPEDWYLIANFTISVIDQNTGYKFSRQINGKHFCSKVEDWGIPQFMHLSSLYSSEFGFIKNESILISVKVEIIDSHIRLLSRKAFRDEMIGNQELTPLHWSAYTGHTEGIIELLNRGANIDAKDKNGRTPLDWAAYKGNFEATKILLQNGAYVDSRDNEGYTPLHKSILSGNIYVVNLLLSKKANYDAIPIFPERKKSSTKLKKNLQPIDKDMDTNNNDFQTTDVIYLNNNSYETDDSKQNHRNPRQAHSQVIAHSPLQMAVRMNSYKIAELLILNNANVNILDFQNRNPLHYSSFRGDLNMMRLLLSHGCKINHQDYQGYTSLHKAIWNEERLSIMELLNANADPTIQSKKGLTSLHLSVLLNQSSIVRSILKLKVWRGPKSTEIFTDDTDIDEVALEKKYWKLKSLEDKPTRSRKSDPGLYPKDIFIYLNRSNNGNREDNMLGDFKVTSNVSMKKIEKKEIVYNGKDILEIKDENGYTPLHYAIIQGNKEIALHLINRGANVNIKAYNKMRPIDLAIHNEDTTMLLMLLENNANIMKSAGELFEYVSHFMTNFREDSSILPSTFSVDMEFIVNNQEFSDVEFNVEGKPIYAWKGILCARSEFFRAMFCSSLKESSTTKIIINDVSYSVFLKIIQYIYTDRLYTNTLNLDEAIRLLSVSDRYILGRLKKLVETWLLYQIDEENVIKLFLSADTFEANTLKIACVQYIITKKILNIKDLSNNKSFRNIIASLLHKSLR